MARALLFSICVPLVFSTSKEEILATLSTQQATHTVMKQIIDELEDILSGASEIQAAEAYAALGKSVFRFYIEPGYKQYTFKTFPFVKELEVPDKLNKPDKLTEETLFAMSNFLLRREILADANNALKAFFQNARPHELQPGEKFVLTLVGCEPNPEAPKYYTAEYMLSSDSNLDDDTLALQKDVMVDLDKINQLWTEMWNNMTEAEQAKHKASCTEESIAEASIVNVTEALSDSHNDKLLFCDSDNIPPNGNSKSDTIPDSNNFAHLQPPKLLPVKKHQNDNLQDNKSILNTIASSDSHNDKLLFCDSDNIPPNGNSKSDTIPDSNNFAHLQPYQEQILELLLQRNIFPIEALNKSPKTHHDSTLHTDRLESSRLLLVKKYHSDGLQDSQSVSEITAPSNSYNDSFLPFNHTRIFIDGHSRV